MLYKAALLEALRRTASPASSGANPYLQWLSGDPCSWDSWSASLLVWARGNREALPRARKRTNWVAQLMSTPYREIARRVAPVTTAGTHGSLGVAQVAAIVKELSWTWPTRTTPKNNSPPSPAFPTDRYLSANLGPQSACEPMRSKFRTGRERLPSLPPVAPNFSGNYRPLLPPDASN